MTKRVGERQGERKKEEEKEKGREGERKRGEGRELKLGTVCARVHGLPLGISWTAGHWFEDANLFKAPVEQVEQAHTEWSELVKYSADKMTTWSTKGHNTIICNNVLSPVLKIIRAQRY